MTKLKEILETIAACDGAHLRIEYYLKPTEKCCLIYINSDLDRFTNVTQLQAKQLAAIADEKELVPGGVKYHFHRNIDLSQKLKALKNVKNFNK